MDGEDLLRYNMASNFISLTTVQCGTPPSSPNFDTDKSYEFFYQVGLSEFGNFGTIEIQDGLDLRELLAISMDKDDSDRITQQSQKDEIEVTPPLTIDVNPRLPSTS